MNAQAQSTRLGDKRPARSPVQIAITTDCPGNDMHDFTLADHPIFSVPESVYNDTTDGDPSEQTGFQSLKHHSSTMVMRGSDLILAAGKELRIANVVDAKVAGSSKAAYKVGRFRMNGLNPVAQNGRFEGPSYGEHRLQHSTAFLEPRRKISRYSWLEQGRRGHPAPVRLLAPYDQQSRGQVRSTPLKYQWTNWPNVVI